MSNALRGSGVRQPHSKTSTGPKQTGLFSITLTGKAKHVTTYHPTFPCPEPQNIPSAADTIIRTQQECPFLRWPSATRNYFFCVKPACAYTIAGKGLLPAHMELRRCRYAHICKGHHPRSECSQSKPTNDQKM